MSLVNIGILCSYEKSEKKVFRKNARDARQTGVVASIEDHAE